MPFTEMPAFVPLIFVPFGITLNLHNVFQKKKMGLRGEVTTTPGHNCLMAESGFKDRCNSFRSQMLGSTPRGAN